MMATPLCGSPEQSTIRDKAMADIVFSEQDLRQIEDTIRYLDPASHELVCALEPQLSGADWDFAVTYMRQRIRSALEIELMARAMADRCTRTNLCDKRGADHYLRSKSWTHNFGIIQTTDEYFAALSAAHDNKLTRALDALILIAQDLLFGSLDEEYERLLNQA